MALSARRPYEIAVKLALDFHRHYHNYALDAVVAVGEFYEVMRSSLVGKDGAHGGDLGR